MIFVSAFRYFFPTFENDGLLFGLPDDDDDFDENLINNLDGFRLQRSYDDQQVVNTEGDVCCDDSKGAVAVCCGKSIFDRNNGNNGESDSIEHDDITPLRNGINTV